MLEWQLFKSYLFSKNAPSLMKRISLLCVCSIALSVGSLILVDSVMNSAHKLIQDRLLSVAPHLSIKIKGAKNFRDLMVHPSYLFLQYHKKPLQVYPYASLDAILHKELGVFQGVKLTSMRKEDLQVFLKKFHFKGVQNPKSLGIQGDEAVVGMDLAHSLSLFEGSSMNLILPESLLLPPDVPLKRGKLKVKYLLHTNTEVDAKDIFYNYGNLKSFDNALGSNITLAIWMKNPHRVSWWKKELSSFADIQVEDWRQKNSTLFHALSLERWLIGLFLALSTFIASFSIVSVLTLLISRKKYDIGLLLSIGLSLKRTKRLFHYIGFILSLVGIGTGTLLGLGISLYLSFFPLDILPSDVYREAKIGASIHFFSVFFIFFASILLSYFISYLPVYGLSKFNVIKLVGRYKF